MSITALQNCLRIQSEVTEPIEPARFPVFSLLLDKPSEKTHQRFVASVFLVYGKRVDPQRPMPLRQDGDQSAVFQVFVYEAQGKVDRNAKAVDDALQTSQRISVERFEIR